MDEHQGFQNGIRFALHIILHCSLKDLIVMVIDCLLNSVNIQKLKKPRYSEQLQQPVEPSILLLTPENSVKREACEKIEDTRSFYVVLSNLLDV